jgi:hypothetical protein
MYKPKNVVPIAATDPAASDPGHVTISIGNTHLRFLADPNIGSTPIGPATLLAFPRADGSQELAIEGQVSDECPDRGRRRVRRISMKAFAIDNETNTITVHASMKEAETVPQAVHFISEDALSKLAAHWPAARLVRIWNQLPDVTLVQKFTDRRTAVQRIWKSLQSLEAAAAPVAPQTPGVALEEGRAKDSATQAKKMSTGGVRKGGREGSKTDTILGLMKQPGGVTLQAIMAATHWQAHSVRGFISGTLARKMGLTVLSTRGENGARTYAIRA